MVKHENFRQFVMDKVNTKVDVSALEEERERIRKLLRQVMGAKTKLTDMLDKLDVMDKHYDRKYQDMHDRLDNLYDKISEYEDSIADITARLCVFCPNFKIDSILRLNLIWMSWM